MTFSDFCGQKSTSTNDMIDDFSKIEKAENLAGKTIKERVERDSFFEWLDKNNQDVEFIFHIGARTDTTEFDKNIFRKGLLKIEKHLIAYDYFIKFSTLYCLNT